MHLESNEKGTGAGQPRVLEALARPTKTTRNGVGRRAAVNAARPSRHILASLANRGVVVREKWQSSRPGS